jgi:beta-glucosidase
MRALYNISGKELSYWCPTVNMGRDPRWGRNDEAFGEDPLLAGKLAAAYVRGIQGKDGKYLKAVSTPKHFAANNSEYNRNTGSSNADEATLREYYLPVFERCFREGGAKSVMTAYNRINGVPASASEFLLQRILYEEWGWDGYTVSDAGAVGDVGPNKNLMWDQVRGHFYAKTMAEACALSLNAGTDICAGTEYRMYLAEALALGLTDEDAMDRALIRAFTARMMLGEFDDAEKQPYFRLGKDDICSAAHADIALKAAEESLVLLKNDGLLPLDGKKIKKLLVVGPNAIYRQLGSYSIGGAADTRICVPPLRGIREAAEGLGIEVEYAKGWHITHSPLGALPGSEVLLREARDAGKELAEYLEERLPEEVRRRTREAEAERVARVNDIKPQPRHPVYDPDLGKDEAELFAEALKKASETDAVVVIAGTDPSVTSEGRDRASLALPYAQDEKIQALLKANPNTAVVLVSAGPATGAFIDAVPALLYSPYAGESQGTAIASALFGVINPGGRTSETWYNDDSELPHISEYGIRVHDTMPQMGRTYLYWLGKPKFAFGHGLSYTSFEYSGFRLNKALFDANDTLTAYAEVTNTGARGGYETVQLYARKINCYDNKPYKQLIGFKKLWLEPGETKTVEISVPLCELKYWNYVHKRFMVENGDYRIWFGKSSDEGGIISSADIKITGKWKAPLSAVTLRCAKRFLPPGEEASFSLTATMMDASRPAADGLRFTVSSSDKSVAVAEDGKIRAVGSGLCLISAELTLDGVTKRACIPIKVS